MSNSTYSLFIIQPVLTSYRLEFFNELSSNFNSTTIYSIHNSGNGFNNNIKGKFNSIHTLLIGDRAKAYYQKGIISSIIKNKPSAIFLTADLRAIHYFIILIISKMLKIPIFPHGQGLYDKPNPSLIHRVLFKTTIWLSSAYICYTKSAYQTLIGIGVKAEKLSIMDNTIVNEFPVRFEDKKNIDNKLLYIGRLRKGCNLELLFDVMKILEEKNIRLTLDIIGDGEQRAQLESYSNKLELNINFLGAIYDYELISAISKDSMIGIYPGDAGLSVVHYMSLSLVPIVHSNLSKHMGPEPSYVQDNKNGVTFKRNSSQDLSKVLLNLLSDKEKIRLLSVNAFQSYTSLSEPSMASKLLGAMKPFLKGRS